MRLRATSLWKKGGAESVNVQSQVKQVRALKAELFNVTESTEYGGQLESGA